MLIYFHKCLISHIYIYIYLLLYKCLLVYVASNSKIICMYIATTCNRIYFCIKHSPKEGQMIETHRKHCCK